MFSLEIEESGSDLHLKPLFQLCPCWLWYDQLSRGFLSAHDSPLDDGDCLTPSGWRLAELWPFSPLYAGWWSTHKAMSGSSLSTFQSYTFGWVQRFRVMVWNCFKDLSIHVGICFFLSISSSGPLALRLAYCPQVSQGCPHCLPLSCLLCLLSLLLPLPLPREGSGV